MSSKENKDRAIAALRKVAEKKAAPYVKKAGKKVQRKIANFTGLDKKTLGKALAVAEMARSGKLKGSARIGKNTRLKGEIDVKNKSIKAGLDFDF